MNNISLNNKKYPIRELFIEGYGNVLISTNSLNSSILDKNYDYKNKESQYVDEKIFFFVDYSDIFKPERDLIKLILDQLV